MQIVLSIVERMFNRWINNTPTQLICQLLFCICYFAYVLSYSVILLNKTLFIGTRVKSSRDKSSPTIWSFLALHIGLQAEPVLNTDENDEISDKFLYTLLLLYTVSDILSIQKTLYYFS